MIEELVEMQNPSSKWKTSESEPQRVGPWNLFQQVLQVILMNEVLEDPLNCRKHLKQLVESLLLLSLN